MAEYCALQVDAYIWPAGAAAAHKFQVRRRTGTQSGQGFYADIRTIVLSRPEDGSAFGRDHADAELSLARAAIDLPGTAMRAVSVQKFGLHLTAALALFLRSAKAGRQLLTAHLEDARKTYRPNCKESAPRGCPHCSGAGVPAGVRRGVATK